MFQSKCCTKSLYRIHLYSICIYTIIIVHSVKVIMQGNWPEIGSIFHIKKSMKYSGHLGNYYVNYQNYQNLMLLTSLVTKRTLMHLFLFTNSAQRELVSMCTQSIRNRNYLSLHYIHRESYLPTILISVL